MEIVNFTPIPALVGGILIGVASALLLLTVGRIFGISGIIGGIYNMQKGDILWRIFVIIGLITGAALGSKISNIDQVMIFRSTPFLIIGGFIMGFGARYGSGCTSGHGVCGISRFSKRSILGTISFMSASLITVSIMNFMGWK